MKKYVRDQRGVAMVLELVLVAAVLLVVGVALYGRYKAMNTSSTTPQAANIAPSTAATGSVDNAVNALTQDAASETVSSNQEDKSMPTTDTSNGTAQNLGGAYNENSF